MCNAWNHPINCRCGWGGEGHLGQSSGGYGAHEASLPSFASWARAHYQSESRGYTNPSARCPVCQAAVFFYQSPDGGRVFFDELGPPWPKHPCTDTRSAGSSPPSFAQRNPLSSVAFAGTTRYRWQDDEWAPFICENFALIPPGAYAAISGYFGDTRLALFVNEKSFIVRAPYQLKRRDDATFLISTVQHQSGAFKVFKVIAYRHLKDALEAGRPNCHAQQAPAKPQPDRHRALPRSQLSLPNQRSRRQEDAPPKTALQLAFERARGAGRSDASLSRNTR